MSHVTKFQRNHFFFFYYDKKRKKMDRIGQCGGMCVSATTTNRCVRTCCVLLTKRSVVAMAVALTLLLYVTFSLDVTSRAALRRQLFEVGRFSTLTPDLAHDLSRVPTNVTSFKGEAGEPWKTVHHFKRVDGREVFLYSAIANHNEPVEGEINIIITAFDSTGTDSGLQCCVVLDDNQIYVTDATTFYKLYIETILGPVLELFKNAPTKAKQYACVVPHIGHRVSHVTLTSASCPKRLESYLPVMYPDVVPGGLAVCAKVAFGDQLDPTRLVEWFEVQRLLGVDRIQLMDLHNPEPIQNVFRYYVEMGLLLLLPYELPGVPYGRGLDNAHAVSDQMTHDETFPILDCRQRLAGFTYILGHDLDEVLVPRKEQTIKALLMEQLKIYPDAAGFFFFTRFFVYDWGPVDPHSDVTYFRFLNSTETRDECKKYAYVTSRVEQARTHTFFPRSSYQQYFVSEEAAILHHYRKCPHVWPTCNPPRVTDHTMLKFQGLLEVRLRKAKQVIGITPAT